MELELRSEFQVRESEQLDEVLREYAARVERLERELRELRAQLSKVLGSRDASLGNPAVLAG
jgi:uncharacterized protein (UPF0335 family)